VHQFTVFAAVAYVLGLRKYTDEKESGENKQFFHGYSFWLMLQSKKNSQHGANLLGERSKFLDMLLYPQIVLVNFEGGLPGYRNKSVWVVVGPKSI
jgi:hypothetical protein